MFRKLKRNILKQQKQFNLNGLAKLFQVALLASTVYLTPAYAQQIVPDGNTVTTLNINNNVTSVSTNTVNGDNAFNSFLKFNVNTGQIVNLKVPDNCTSLINLIHDEQTSIDGVLNSIKNGHIGGHLFLVNPHGIAIGSQGVINVGSLTAITPTKDYTDNFFDAPGIVNDDSMQALLNGNVPVNSDAIINIEGKINAIENVRLDTGSVINSGEIYSGSVFEENDIAIGDVVNVNKLESGAEIVKNSGNIKITATKDIINTGNIIADGGNNIDGGEIDVVAGNDVYLNEGSLVSAKGKGENSSGGNIYIWGNNDTTFEKDAFIDVRGGDISGDAGFIELSAFNNVLVGGEFKAYSYNGKQGSIFIDPITVDGSVQFSNDIYTNGADFTISGNNKIEIEGTVISTRQIAGNNNLNSHLNEGSIGNSGNLTITAPDITVDKDATLITFADQGFTCGDIKITADGNVFK